MLWLCCRWCRHPRSWDGGVVNSNGEDAGKLAEGVELEEFGGSVQLVETAATAGIGLTELEEALLLQV